MNFSVNGVELNNLPLGRLQTITKVKAFLDQLEDGQLLTTDKVRDAVAPGNQHLLKFLRDRKYNQLLDHSMRDGGRTLWGNVRSIQHLRETEAANGGAQ